MQKDEMLAVHALLYRIRNNLLNSGVAKIELFAEYDALNILPTHVMKSKGEHRRAIFLLGKALSMTTEGQSDTPFSNAEMTARRFGAIATSTPAPAPTERL